MDKTKLLVVGGLLAAAFLVTRRANAATVAPAPASFSGLTGGTSMPPVSSASAGALPTLAAVLSAITGQNSAPAPAPAPTYSAPPAPAPALEPAPAPAPVWAPYGIGAPAYLDPTISDSALAGG